MLYLLIAYMAVALVVWYVTAGAVFVQYTSLIESLVIGLLAGFFWPVIALALLLDRAHSAASKRDLGRRIGNFIFRANR